MSARWSERAHLEVAVDHAHAVHVGDGVGHLRHDPAAERSHEAEPAAVACPKAAAPRALLGHAAVLLLREEVEKVAALDAALCETRPPAPPPPRSQLEHEVQKVLGVKDVKQADDVRVVSAARRVRKGGARPQALTGGGGSPPRPG